MSKPSVITADQIAVAHTPPGGCGATMPPPVMVDGAIDPIHRAIGAEQRIERTSDA